MVVNEFSWTELATSDVDGAADFYGALFDWRLQRKECGGALFVELAPDSDPRGGIMQQEDASVPPSWTPYVHVEDLDETLRKAQDLGGACIVPVTEFPGGAFAVITDPRGARLGVYRTTPV